ncbi:MAG: tRNA preQ1(34) S-adenosylmethionine ribosyltransferase-isomerase QueA [Planctomycetes bacterium]|nr:tRNA preQ1(34) S-adenosylmethionine ribosyltransferase-isomerase QueA [Planctomycetota bacterium]
MNIEQLDYDLPPELIAQQPAEPRDHSRLLVLDRHSGTFAHHIFADLPTLLRPPDCLVINDTRVLPARLVGRRAATGGHWEGLFLRETASGLWEVMCRTRGRLRPGESIFVNGSESKLVLRDRTGEGHWLVQPEPAQSPAEFLSRHGHVPLPPYIGGNREESVDGQRYQTVFAERAGAVAAPTAGLHFSPSLMAVIQSHGIEFVRLTLHVGPGTFQPIRDSIESHVMHAEWCELTGEAARQIRRCRAGGGRVVAVGTTCVRVLETAAQGGELEPWCGETSLFILPPYRFRASDALITNFHLPRTTLLALVYAFAGQELCRAAYAEAIRLRYRFYSFGDAMLIV